MNTKSMNNEYYTDKLCPVHTWVITGKDNIDGKCHCFHFDDELAKKLFKNNPNKIEEFNIPDLRGIFPTLKED